MGSVYRPYVTRPLPSGAVVEMRDGKAVATWVDRRGKRQHAAVTNGEKGPRIRAQSGTYVAKYRDASGVLQCVSTGCRGKDTARAKLADLEARAEKVRAGIVTEAEAGVADHADTPVNEHIAAYVAALSRKRGKGARPAVSKQHVKNVDRGIRTAIDECGFRRLRDLRADAVERWVNRMLELPDRAVVGTDGKVMTPRRPAPRTVNAKLAALKAWGNWLVQSGRLAANPFSRLGKVDESDDARRKRRALTVDELKRLLIVARLRPVAQFGRPVVPREGHARVTGSRSSWKRADLKFDDIVTAAKQGRARVRPEVAEGYDRLGRERVLIYLVLVTTGLRRGELAALTVADVRLDDASPVIVLRGVNAKNGRGADLPLRDDVAAELRAWIDEKADEVRRQGGVASSLDDRPLFNVPEKLSKILNRDLAAAGIPKRDGQGRTFDVHALRGTFASHLAADGVAPLTLRKLMRHEKIETTLKHYADPALLDTASAVERLPSLVTATNAGAVAPNVAPTPVMACQKPSFPDSSTTRRPTKKKPVSPAKTTGNTGISSMGDIGLEPMTPSLSS